MSERPLATIRTIGSITPIPDKDRIVLAQVDGWSVIIQKDEYRVGDMCIYCEVDSILPEKPEFEFLRSRKFRIKTLKMAGVYSQGICFPLSILPQNKKYKLGEDVTDVLGVKKYEADVEYVEPQSGFLKHPFIKYLLKFKLFRWLLLPKKENRGFPDFIRKTDENNIQNLPHYFSSDYKNVPFTVREKMEGCFDGRTKIFTDIGEIEINKIVRKRMNVKILSYNKVTGKSEYKKILDYHKNNVKNKTFYKIGFPKQARSNVIKYIECTDNHLFFVGNNKWKRADELKRNDVVYHFSKDNINSNTEEMLLGCLLGDSSFNSNSETGFYRVVQFNHSEKQKEYFEYKKYLLGNLFMQDKNVISGKGSIMLRGKTESNTSIWNMINDHCLDEHGKKHITQKWCDKITPLSIAFWYMDDGSCSFSDKQRPRAIFHTQGFSYEECLILSNTLKKFGIQNNIGDKEIYRGYIIQLSADGTEKLFDIIYPYVCESMKYKLSEKYRNKKSVLKRGVFKTYDTIIKTKVKSSEILQFNYEIMYDLTIEDNENYFANGILVHNCSGTWFLKRNKGKFEFGVCSRNLRLGKPDNSSYWKVAIKYGLENVLKQIIGNNDWICLQGEVCGPGIQGNIYNLKEIDVYAFNLIIEGNSIDDAEGERILSLHGIKWCPLINKEYYLHETVNDILNYSNGKSLIHDTDREGLVFRNYDLGISFKARSPKYLLKADS